MRRPELAFRPGISNSARQGEPEEPPDDIQNTVRPTTPPSALSRPIALVQNVGRGETKWQQDPAECWTGSRQHRRARGECTPKRSKA